jgi:hypothetical protein
MEAIREYLIGVVAAGIICSVIVRLPVSGSVAGILRLVAGLIMALSVASPLVELRITDLSDYWQQIQYSGQDYADQGENIARQQRNAIIKERTRTYILDKAESLGAQLDVEVTLTDDEIGRPCAVRLTGSISPYDKQILTDYILESLGLDTEALTWMAQ